MTYIRTRKFGTQQQVDTKVENKVGDVTPETIQRGVNLLYELEGMNNEVEMKIRELLKQSFRGYPNVHYEAVARDLKDLL